MLYPIDYRAGGNKVLLEKTCKTQKEAVDYFGAWYPSLRLNNEGYCKVGEVSYCVAEFFC